MTSRERRPPPDGEPAARRPARAPRPVRRLLPEPVDPAAHVTAPAHVTVSVHVTGPAHGQGVVRIRDVQDLQRSAGNEVTRALLQRRTELTVQRGGPDDIHAAVAAAKQADDPMAVIRLMDRPDFGQATDDERISCIRIIVGKGGGDPQRLARLWNSFPEARLPEVAMKYLTDWEATAKAWPGVPDLVTAVPKAVDAFRARLRAEAEANLADNAAYVKQRMDQLGYGSAPATLTAAEQTSLRRTIQSAAYHLSTLRATQEKAKRVPIGRTVGRVSLPVTFDPAGPEAHDGPKSIDRAKWDAVKREWDDAQKPIATAAANHPELYELLARPDSEQALLNFSRITAEGPGNRPGTSDGAAPGQGYQTQAKNLLTDLAKRIDGARRDLAGLDMLDLPTLHTRVYAAAGPYASGFGQWVAKRAVERHVRDAHTMKVLAQMGEGGALLVATIATGGLALAITAVGTGVGVAHAAVDYAEAGKLENLARATPKKGTELISRPRPTRRWWRPVPRCSRRPSR